MRIYTLGSFSMSKWYSLLSATDCEALQYKNLISVVLAEVNTCRVRIRLNTTSNILLGMRSIAFPNEQFEKLVVSQIEM